jgi:hypothetical protein
MSTKLFSLRVRRWRWLALAASAAAITFAIPGTASASTPCSGSTSSGHCYGVENWWNQPSMWGGLADLEAAKLSSADPSNGFLSNELWVSTAGAADPRTYWVEEGDNDGVVLGADYGLSWFWADNRPNGGGYHEHYYNAATLSHTDAARIDWAGNSTWNVLVDGVAIGSSTSNPCCSHGFSAGIESTDNADVASVYDQNLQKEDTSGNWSYDWSGATPEQESPASVWWTTQYLDLNGAENN